MQQLKLVWVVLHAIFREDTTLNGSYISPKQHFDNIEDFKVTEKRNSFKTIKDILLIILSKNNGILRIIEAKFDGEKRRNLQHTAEFAKWPRWANLSVLNIGRFACSVMQNTTIMFKTNAKFDKREKIFGKNKNNPLCQCCDLNYA